MPTKTPITVPHPIDRLSDMHWKVETRQGDGSSTTTVATRVSYDSERIQVESSSTA